MNAHTTKPTFVATTDGLFKLDAATGHYEPYQVEEETRWPLWQGMVPVILGGWAILGGIYLAFAG